MRRDATRRVQHTKNSRCNARKRKTLDDNKLIVIQILKKKNGRKEFWSKIYRRDTWPVAAQQQQQRKSWMSPASSPRTTRTIAITILLHSRMSGDRSAIMQRFQSVSRLIFISTSSCPAAQQSPLIISIRNQSTAVYKPVTFVSTQKGLEGDVSGR